VDSAQIHNPDPISTYFVPGKIPNFIFITEITLEAERFDKDFAVIDKKVREKVYTKKDDKLTHLR
jgi:hypothetical protein